MSNPDQLTGKGKAWLKKLKQDDGKCEPSQRCVHPHKMLPLELKMPATDGSDIGKPMLGNYLLPAELQELPLDHFEFYRSRTGTAMGWRLTSLGREAASAA